VKAGEHGANRTVFLFDVDNTLLDNDRVVVDLKRYLVRDLCNDTDSRIHMTRTLSRYHRSW